MMTDRRMTATAESRNVIIKAVQLAKLLLCILQKHEVLHLKTFELCQARPVALLSVTSVNVSLFVTSLPNQHV